MQGESINWIIKLPPLQINMVCKEFYIEICKIISE
jgi:hypothetical protein